MTIQNSEIPIIDFEGFGDGTSQRAMEIGEQFYAACRDVGFAYLVNTGVPQEEVDAIFSWSKKFFELPYDVKMTAPHPPRGDQHRGYSGVGVEQVSQMVFDEDKLHELRGKGADFKESFDMGSGDSQRCHNVWIEDHYLPGFRAGAEHFMSIGRALQEKALHALALGMPHVPTDFFDKYHTDADNQLRLLHSPWSVFESGEKGRIGAHTDFSTCTFLFQDDVGGLEVESPSQPGTFIPAPPIKGAVVFNIGDFLMRWSNDELHSTLHRVRAPARRPEDGEMTRERFSIPYFCSANANMTIDALPGTFGPERPKKYEPITAGEYVNMRLNATYVGSGIKGSA
ncbi:hypothetical protein CcaverHIS002_0608180 [Cutaneotrichosporon cavernicola]|nr:hypothetical protein CcaverHIS002_0608180 [Cutaneotrichosporon cavernicola]BEJ09844.1 hypothetical protein CcaverHIS641_0607590 [Cutaneotrichosporon cavernicola]